MRLSYVWCNECERFARRPTVFLSGHFVQEWPSHNANERPIPAHPVLSERPRCVASHTAHDEQSAILKDVAHPNVNARKNVLFVHEYPCDDMLNYVFAHNWI